MKMPEKANVVYDCVVFYKKKYKSKSDPGRPSIKPTFHSDLQSHIKCTRALGEERGEKVTDKTSDISAVYLHRWF